MSEEWILDLHEWMIQDLLQSEAIFRIMTKHTVNQVLSMWMVVIDELLEYNLHLFLIFNVIEVTQTYNQIV